MPFISQKDTRELSQGLTPYEESFTPEFGEVFAASVGHVIDEELSISNALNREGWRERERLTRDILDADENLNRHDYTDRRGRFDYDRFAEDSGDDRVKTDAQLNEERNAVLESRRNYAESVMERGSGMAQFLGMATGYMLDPFNIATIGVGSSASAAKATTTIGKALFGARDAAVIGSATELAIQPLVYQHKSDIGSPYSAQDAIEAIAGAGVGGAAIGAFTGGLSGFVRSIRKAADDLPETGDIKQAKESLDAFEQTLKNAPDREVDQKLYEQYSALISKENKAALKNIDDEVKALESELKKVEKSETIQQQIAKAGGLNRKAFGAEGIDPENFKRSNVVFGKPLFPKEGGFTPDSLAEFLNQGGATKFTANDMVDLTDTLTRGKMYAPDVEAKITDLTRQIDELSMNPEESLIKREYGTVSEIDDEGLAAWVKAKNEQQIEAEVSYLRELEAQKAINDQPSRTAEQYDLPEEVLDEPTLNQTYDGKIPREQLEAILEGEEYTPKLAQGRESEILESAGVKKDFDRDMQSFSQLDNPRAIMDGEIVDAADIMKGFDDELEGINSLLVCTRG